MGMKEHNYTIPLTEAIEEGGGCFLCKIEKELSDRALEYYMGAAVMEPSVRIETNARGFCRTHGEAMLAMPKKLPLILALQTRLDTLEKEFVKAKKPGKHREKTCAVCERVSRQMDKCIENCLWLLQKEPDFLEKYLQSEGVCLSHFYALAAKMGKGDAALYKVLHTHMAEKLARLRGDMDTFARSFDYQSAPVKNIGHIPREAVETLTDK